MLEKEPPPLPALYTDRWVYDPGDVIEVMAEGAGEAAFVLTRLCGLKGEARPHGFVEETLTAPVAARLGKQALDKGSRATTFAGPNVSSASSWKWQLSIHPTRGGAGTVLDWGNGALRLQLREGRLVALLGHVEIGAHLDLGSWTFVEVALSRDGVLCLSTRPQGPGYRYRSSFKVEFPAFTLDIAGALEIGRGFNGKISGPGLWVDDLLAAQWDFAASMSSQTVPGTGVQARPLELINAPQRAVTGPEWNGSHHHWRDAPSEYDSIYFHDDDLSDCRWATTARIEVPDDAGSGIYAIRMSLGSMTRYTPVFIRPVQNRRLVFLASTFSYLAYGNSLWASPSGKQLEADYPEETSQMRRFGLSTYARHTDGSGIGLVSTRRPILNCAPGFLGEVAGGQVLLCDDLRIISWLDSTGEPYDVVTDHDLHERGDAALSGCDLLITGAHPEYHSAQTLDALEAFQGRGGRMIYLGGNGFYWRVSTLPDAPHIMEVRRAENGIRMWAEEPGQYHHQSDGQLGGLWRRIGCPPNRLTGVGYSGQGDETDSAPYRKTDAAGDLRARFLFEGIEADVFGENRGLVAAAGYEIDRFDPRLGSPAHALVVATSLPFGAAMLPVNEERLTHTLIDAEQPLRSDITFYETPAGGAVLSFGSVFLATALDEAHGAGRLMHNAVQRFLDPAPFEMPASKVSSSHED